MGSTPGLGRPPGEGNGYSLQYFCLEQRRLASYSPWGPKELDTMERLKLRHLPIANRHKVQSIQEARFNINHSD